MDGNNLRTAQAQGQAPAGNSAALAPVPANGAVETGDWRAQLNQASRQRIVNKMMESLLPFTRQGHHELRESAARFEEKVYAAALNQTDYLRKIALKILSQLKSQTYQKIKSMKDKYFMDLNDFKRKISGILAQWESLPKQPPIDHVNKLKNYETMVESLLQILQLNKSEILPEHKEKIGPIEEQIHFFLNM